MTCFSIHYKASSIKEIIASYPAIIDKRSFTRSFAVRLYPMSGDRVLHTSIELNHTLSLHVAQIPSLGFPLNV